MYVRRYVGSYTMQQHSCLLVVLRAYLHRKSWQWVLLHSLMPPQHTPSFPQSQIHISKRVQRRGGGGVRTTQRQDINPKHIMAYICTQDQPYEQYKLLHTHRHTHLQESTIRTYNEGNLGRPTHLHHVTNASCSGRDVHGTVGIEVSQVDDGVPVNVLTGSHPVAHSISRDVRRHWKLDQKTVHCVISVQFINPCQEITLRRQREEMGGP